MDAGNDGVRFWGSLCIYSIWCRARLSAIHNTSRDVAQYSRCADCGDDHLPDLPFSRSGCKAIQIVGGRTWVSHLALDELYSVDFRGRRLKRSSGTALKFWGKKAWPNYTTYGKLAFLVLLIFSDGPLMNHYGHEPLDIPWSAWVDDLWDKSLVR